MAKINTYTTAGTKGSINFSKALQEKINMDLLAQAVRVYKDRSHPGLSKVKTRSEVSLTTAKVWRQKGTGRARHGARSAPIFVGGGVAHGPKGVKRTLKLPKKMAKKSFFSVLSLKAKEGKIIVVSNLSKINKTKEAQKLIDTIVAKEGLKKDVKVSLIIKSENIQTKKAFRNLENVKIFYSENLNTLDIFYSSLLIFEKETFEILAKNTAVGDKTDKKRKNSEVSESTEKKKSVKVVEETKDARKSNIEKTKKAKKMRVRTTKTRSKKEVK